MFTDFKIIFLSESNFVFFPRKLSIDKSYSIPYYVNYSLEMGV